MAELLFLAAAFRAGYMLARIRRPGVAPPSAGIDDPAAKLQALSLATVACAALSERDDLEEGREVMVRLLDGHFDVIGEGLGS